MFRPKGNGVFSRDNLPNARDDKLRASARAEALSLSSRAFGRLSRENTPFPFGRNIYFAADFKNYTEASKKPAYFARNLSS